MRRGFTLVETGLSLALIGLVLVFVLNLFPSALFAQRRAEQRLVASSIARSVIEEQMDQPFRLLTVGLRRDLPPQTIDGVEYVTTLEVDSSPQADPKFLRILRSTVRWKAYGLAFKIQREVYKHKLPSSSS